MKRLPCKIKTYKLHHYKDLEGNIRHKQFSHIVYALNCQRLDKGYDFCQILGYINHAGQYEIEDDFKLSCTAAVKYGLDMNERTMQDIEIILQAYSKGNKGRKAINTITFDYDSDYDLYKCSGNIRFNENCDYVYANLNVLAKSLEDAQGKIDRYYQIEDREAFKITKIN